MATARKGRSLIRSKWTKLALVLLALWEIRGWVVLATAGPVAANSAYHWGYHAAENLFGGLLP